MMCATDSHNTTDGDRTPDTVPEAEATEIPAFVVVGQVYCVGLALAVLACGALAAWQRDSFMEAVYALGAALVGLVASSLLIAVAAEHYKSAYTMGIAAFFTTVVLLLLDAFVSKIGFNF